MHHKVAAKNLALNSGVAGDGGDACVERSGVVSQLGVSIITDAVTSRMNTH